MRRFLFFWTIALITCACGLARADFMTHAGGHGPIGGLSGSSPIATWGEIQTCCMTGGFAQGFIGSEGGAYWALPTAGQTWVRKSPAPNTYATAWEFSSWPWGRSYTGTSTWVQLPWSPELVVIQYDNPCPITPGMAVAHCCSPDWTPMDNGGDQTCVVGNGIVKPGLPYGDYLKDTSGGGPGSWCTFNFSDYPGVQQPPGVPNHAVAVDSCP